MKIKEAQKIATEYRNKYCKVLAKGNLDYIRLLAKYKLPWEEKSYRQKTK